MSEIPQTVIDALLPLCTERQVEKDIRDSADTRCKTLSDQIGAVMIAHDLVAADGKGKVDLGFYKVSVFPKAKDTIDAQALTIYLVDQGVDIDVIKTAIAAATKTSKWSEVRIAQAGQPDEA